MARAFTPALLDFSTGLNGALDEHAAEVSGSGPSLNLKERGQARQAFLGSIVCLDDGSVHLVGLKNGVVDTGSGICLRLTRRWRWSGQTDLPGRVGAIGEVAPTKCRVPAPPRPGLKGEFDPRAPKFAARNLEAPKFA